jgi:hypothetical protein
MRSVPLSRFRPDEFVVVHEGSDRPAISMLMPVYRQERSVEQAVRSVLGQTGVDCEIIISDDASGDTTFERAWSAVNDLAGAFGADHHVVMRRGQHRLGRDHVPRLVAGAGCDVVAQAHGDDIARPYRAQRLLEAMTRTGAAMAASVTDDIDDRGRLIAPARPDWAGDWSMSLDDVLEYWPWLIGATQCWSRRALEPFEPLAVRFAPVNHDLMMPVRAWFAGGVVAVADPLLQRRRHSENWSNAIFDRQSVASRGFAKALAAMCTAEVLLDDLTTVEDQAMAAPDVVAHAREVLTSSHRDACQKIRESYGALVSEGKLPLWVGDDEIRLANQGALRAQLVRDARFLDPLVRARHIYRRMKDRVRVLGTRMPP